MTRPGPGREALWLEVERDLRLFVRKCEAEPEWLLPPPVAQLVRAVKPKLELLGGEIWPGRGGGGATPERAHRGE